MHTESWGGGSATTDGVRRNKLGDAALRFGVMREMEMNGCLASTRGPLADETLVARLDGWMVGWVSGPCLGLLVLMVWYLLLDDTVQTKPRTKASQVKVQAVTAEKKDGSVWWRVWPPVWMDKDMDMDHQASERTD